jgi:hypothetical protein
MYTGKCKLITNVIHYHRNIEIGHNQNYSLFLQLKYILYYNNLSLLFIG